MMFTKIMNIDIDLEYIIWLDRIAVPVGEVSSVSWLFSLAVTPQQCNTAHL